MDELSEIGVRQQAARRKARLLLRGNERIHQIQFGRSPEEKKKNETPQPENSTLPVHDTFLSHICSSSDNLRPSTSRLNSDSFNQSPVRLNSEFKDNMLPFDLASFSSTLFNQNRNESLPNIDPQVLFSSLGLPGLSNRMGQVTSEISSTEPSQTSTRFSESFYSRQKKLHTIQAARLPLMLIMGCLAVIISSLMGKIMNWKDNEDYFFRLNGITRSIFILVEIGIQLYLIPGWKSLQSADIFFNFGLLLPVMQLITMVITFRQLLSIGVTIIIIGGLYYWKIRQQGAQLLQFLIGLTLTHSLELLQSFSSIKSYISDYALYCFSNAAMILLILLYCRYFSP